MINEFVYKRTPSLCFFLLFFLRADIFMREFLFHSYHNAYKLTYQSFLLYSY